MVTRNQTTSNISTLSNRFRTKKLSLRQALTVLREADFDSSINDDPTSLRQDALSNLPKVETGVESKEEKEHHLQAVISASHAAAVGAKVAQLYIPTPDAVPAAGIEYGRLYPSNFAQPATYIRFSSAVEDSVGCPYCMTEEDDAWLQALNERRQDGRGTATNAECTEDQFEAVIQFFEDQSLQKQPFAAVDHTPVLNFEEMEAAFDETIDDNARHFAKQIYDYWRTQRISRNNQGLMAKLKTLKMDSGQEADDSDPYVCFRRREVRQVRKTRGRDAQVSEKLKKLRKELEDAREILNYVKNREVLRVRDLASSRQVFEQRASLRNLKRTLNITGNEDHELLITQKTPKKKVIEQPIAQARGPGLQLRVPNRVDSLAAEIQQISFSDKWDSEQRDIANRVSEGIVKHDRWNEGFSDRTLDAALRNLSFTPDPDELDDHFVKVQVDMHQDYLMTPPASIMDDSASDEGQQPEDLEKRGNLNIAWVNSAGRLAMKDESSFRLRHGRNGRLWLDRRPPANLQGKESDRWAYDHDSSDEDPPDLNFDDLFSLKYRFHLKAKDDHMRHAREQELQRRHLANADSSTTNNPPAVASTS